MAMAISTLIIMVAHFKRLIKGFVREVIHLKDAVGRGVCADHIILHFLFKLYFNIFRGGFNHPAKVHQEI